MSDSRALIPFLEQPAAFEGEKKRRPKVHKTIRGRVVYNRKRHFFTTKDVRRILKNILEQDQGVRTNYLDFLAEWGEIELMLLDLLAQQGGFFGDSPLYKLIREYVVLLSAGAYDVPAPKK